MELPTVADVAWLRERAHVDIRGWHFQRPTDAAPHSRNAEIQFVCSSCMHAVHGIRTEYVMQDGGWTTRYVVYHGACIGCGHDYGWVASETCIG